MACSFTDVSGPSKIAAPKPPSPNQLPSQPLVANAPTPFAIPLRSHDHVFLKGHKIMVQVQSTWFPLIDRNPQKFVPSIYEAKAEDFVSATQRIYASSYVTLPVVK